MPYPNVVELLAPWLEAQRGVRAGGKVPADLGAPGVLPFNAVSRVGGADTAPGIDAATVDIDSYAGPDAADPEVTADVAASREAELVRDAILYSLPGTHFPGLGAWVTVTSTVTAPREREYDTDDTDIARYQGMYRVVVRSTA